MENRPTNRLKVVFAERRQTNKWLAAQLGIDQTTVSKWCTNSIERFLPGAYIQYVKFRGKGKGGEVEREYKFSGNLMKVLYQLDTFVDTTITNRRPVPVSVLREETIVDYPHWATRELLMNSICHRTYDSNGPIQFYQYDDRIEILNHGGVYGKANADNFPNVNDYRNTIIAEALRVLGFVNRSSRGIQRVEHDLLENGNGQPEFDLSLGTAFKVIERKAHMDETERETENLSSKFSLSETQRKVFHLLCMNSDITYAELKKQTNLSRGYLSRVIASLRENGYVVRIGSDRNGRWEIRKSLTD